MTRLIELGLADFTGGINVRDDTFQLAATESPQMLNMRADDRGGIYTRLGWRRWNNTNIVAGDWEPRNGTEHDYSDGTFRVFVTHNNLVYESGTDATFSVLAEGDATPAHCNANPHLADFASWSDNTYIATGRKADEIGGAPLRVDQSAVAVRLTPAGDGSWNPDYTTPVQGVMPQADYVEAHAGHLFVASTKENDLVGGVQNHEDRLRWSHPNDPEDWAKSDYIDITAGGGHITGLQSFQDHLLIFKTDSLWALYGYDTDSWQLVKVSRSAGCLAPTAVARSDQAIYYYSPSGRGNVYVYLGEGAPTSISSPLENALEEISFTQVEDVFLGWVLNRLIVSVPWIASWDDNARTLDPNPTHSVFAFVPETGGGAWELHRPAKGNVGPIIERSDSKGESSLMCFYGDGTNSCVARFGGSLGAADYIDEVSLNPLPFATRYATSWQFAEHPDILKSWRRPRFVVRNNDDDTTLRFDIFYDYNETTPIRSWTLFIDSDGSYRWRDEGALAVEGDGFDWGPTDPAAEGVWAEKARGSRLVRGKSLGHARAVQVVVSTAPSAVGTAWGIDAMILKFVNRRFTT